MKNKIIFAVLVSISVIVGIGCKKSVPDGPAGTATRVFPNQNAACTTGTNISDTQSSITFSWGAAANATSYELNLKNLFTNVITTHGTNTNQATLTLERNTPYSWFIVSKSAISTSKSDAWKFYNSVPAIISHAPFPADVIAPSVGQNVSGTKINLSWLGSDVDNDIAGYDIFFGSSTSPPLLKADVTVGFLNDVNLVTGITYYWKIVTKDSQGNTSNSALFQFKAN